MVCCSDHTWKLVSLHLHVTCLSCIVTKLTSSTVVGCSLAFSCTPKDVKVHADDNGTIALLTNPTSFIAII